ncbi:response regulator [Paraferrimonas haliotis]|uniref:DNA-binding response regulator n=1 Tax=Paraferrimonas haliotis TaxID=2013866 RepID=A0AA37TTX6_9GAMM|nr:response regulator [Paraferrimonas haliotis]GLS84402.1 DNA-binding response regulator [Paraferrimonas haliotis]
MTRIAIVEDEDALRENYAEKLTKLGYQVSSYSNRRSAEEAFSVQLPDLAIIDIGLEDEIDGGFDLCQWLRAKSDKLPIIFLTARDDEFDLTTGFAKGGNDYLSKSAPFHQLRLRIQSLISLAQANQQPDVTEQAIEAGLVSIKEGQKLVTYNSQEIDLTLTEFWIVLALVRRPGQVKSRDQLMEAANLTVDPNSINSHIKRIRKKFSGIDSDFDSLKTVHGMGYRWVVTE